MKAVLTVIGKDTVGILAKIANLCAARNVNIDDVTQTVMQEYFCMIMMCDIDKINTYFAAFVDEARQIGADNALEIHVMHEDVFNSMHRI